MTDPGLPQPVDDSAACVALLERFGERWQVTREPRAGKCWLIVAERRPPRPDGVRIIRTSLGDMAEALEGQLI